MAYRLIPSILVLLITLVANPSRAQVGVSFTESSKILTRSDAQQLTDSFFARYPELHLQPAAYLRITLHLDQQGLHRLEGIATRHSGTAEATFTLTDELRDQTIRFAQDLSVQGSQGEQPLSAVFTALLLRQPQWQDTLAQHLRSIASRAAIDCPDLLPSPTGSTTDIHHLSRLGATFPACRASARAQIDQILRETDQERCDQLLYEAEVLLEVRNPANLNRAVRKLLAIPPLPDCRDRALDLIYKLGSDVRVHSSNRKRLNTYRQWVIEQNLEAWLEQGLLE